MTFSSRVFQFLSVLALVLPCTDALAQSPSFHGLGTLNPSEGFYSKADGVSPEGSYVIGKSLRTFASSPNPTFSFYRWNATTGMQEIYPNVIQTTQDTISEISLGGGVATGWRSTDTTHAFQWKPASGLTALGGNNNAGLALSNDGSVIVGSAGANHSAYQPAKWTSGTLSFFTMPTHTVNEFGIPREVPFDHGQATDVSDNGTIAVGYVEDLGTVRWNADGSWTTIKADGDRYAATSISGDGSVIIGRDWRWSQTSGFLTLGFNPIDVSEDGSIIIGSDKVWDSGHGTRDIKSVLTGDYGLDLTGWTISATAISDSGLTIVGNGINPNGLQEAWIACIPEPGTVPMMVLGAAFLGWCRHRSRKRRN